MAQDVVMLRAFCYTIFGIKAQFIMRTEETMVLAHRASYDKKTLARQVIPLAPGYRTALSSCPEVCFPEEASHVSWLASGW